MRRIKFLLWLPFALARGLWLATRNSLRLEHAIRKARVNRDGLVCYPSGKPITVGIRPAFCWTCDVCGIENFFAVRYRQPTESQAIRIAQIEGLCGEHGTIEDVPDAIRQREIGQLPSVVECCVCWTKCAVEMCGCDCCEGDACSDD